MLLWYMTWHWNITAMKSFFSIGRLEHFSRRRWGLASTQVEGCRVYKIAKMVETVQEAHLPNLLHSWPDLSLHLLLLKSSMDWLIPGSFSISAALETCTSKRSTVRFQSRAVFILTVNCILKIEIEEKRGQEVNKLPYPYAFVHTLSSS